MFAIQASERMNIQHSLKLGAIGLSIALVLFAVAGYLLIPAIARNQLEKILSEELDRKTTIERVRFDPFRLHLTVAGIRVDTHRRGAAIDNSTQALFSLSKLEAHASWRSLTERAPIISSLLISEPSIRISRDAAGRYDFQDIVERAQARFAAKPKLADDAAKPIASFSVANIELNQGLVQFDDTAYGQSHRIETLQIRIPFLSSLAVDQAIFVEPGIAAKVNGSSFDLKGKSKPFSPNRESTLELALDAVDLTRYLGYSPLPLPIKVVRGAVSLASVIEFAQPVGAKPSVTIRGNATVIQPDLREHNDRPLLTADTVKISGMVLRPLEASYEIASVRLIKPHVTVQRLANDHAWFASMLSPATAKDHAAASPASDKAAGNTTASNTAASNTAASNTAASNTAAAKPPPQWRLAQLRVDNGLIDYRDEQFKPKTLAQQLRNVKVKLDGLSSDQSALVRFEASHDTALDEESAVQGQLRIKPLELDGDAKIERLKLKQLWWLADPYLSFDLTNGQLDSTAHFKVTVVDGRADVKLSALGFHLTRLVLQQRRDKLDFLKLPELKVTQAAFDLAAKRIELGRIESSSATIEVRRDNDGKFNMAKLRAPTTEPIDRPVIAKTAQSKPSPPLPLPVTATSSSAPWIVTLDSLSADRYSLGFKDAKAGRAADAMLTNVAIRADKLSTEAGVRGKISISSRVNKDGQANVAGQLALQPLAMKLRLDLKQLNIVPMQPYFAEYLNAIVASGTLMANGDLSVDVPKASKATVQYRGALALTNFDLLGNDGKQKLMRWQSLHFSGVDVISEPLQMALGDITLTDLQSRVVRHADGHLNLRDILAKRDSDSSNKSASTPLAANATNAATSTPVAATTASTSTAEQSGDPRSANNELSPPPSAPPAPPAQVANAATTAAPTHSIADKLSFGRLTLVNGESDFSDLAIQPRFRAKLSQVNGTVSSMSRREAGTVDLKGRVNEVGQLAVNGRINPLSPDLFLDLQLSASDIDMPVVTPYSEKYIGYGIDKGKLSIQLKYALQERALKAQNHLVLDQLSFGQKVESPTAIKAPVLFAVSLLKDRHGVIDVNLPVSGTLDDPKFSVAGIIWQVIGNLIVKAVTSPFSLIAGLAGGSEEQLSQLDFAPGQTQLDDDARVRLKSIAKALADRPSLKLDLAGSADPQRDGEQLRQRRVERLVKAEKLKETVSTGASSELIDKVKIEPAEQDRFLRRAYDNAAFDKPRDSKDKNTDPTREQMQSQLSANVTVSASDLTTLASARAQAAKQWLQTEGGIDPERLFVVASHAQPNDAKAGESNGGPDSKAQASVKLGVELKLK